MATTKTIDIRTAIPGPRSPEILARKERVIANAKSIVLPIVAQEGRGATLTDVDGNIFIDFTGGVGCLNVGHAHPRVVEAAAGAARALHRTPTSRSSPTSSTSSSPSGCSSARRSRPGQGGVLQRRHRGGRERGQVRAALHQAAGRDRLRGRLPRPHADVDDAHLEAAPVQGRDGAVRARGLPRAVPAATTAAPTPTTALAALERALRHAGRAPSRSPRSSSSPSRARAASSPRRAGVHAGPARDLRRARDRA